MAEARALLHDRLRLTPLADSKGDETAIDPLREGEERFRLLVETVKEYAIFMLDPKGVVATWNAGAERIKGYRADEIIGRHFSVFYPPSDVWKCDKELETARAEGRVEDEGWRVRKDGSRFWANVVITCLRDRGGEIVGYAKVTRDMTARRATEEALRQSEERLRLLVENVRDYAIFMLDPNGRIALWNEGAERLLGYSAGEIVGQPVSRFYVEADVVAKKEERELSVAGNEGRFEDEGWRVRKDGSRFWANVIVTPLRDATSHALVGFAKVVRDLTERKRAEEERARLGEEARMRMKILSELSEGLASTTTIEEVARAVTELGTTFTGADTWTFHVRDDATETLDLIAQRGCAPPIVAALRTIGPDSANPSHAIGTGRAPTVWIENEAAYEEYFPAMAAREVEGRRARAFWCTPLIAEGRAIGMLGAGYHRPRRFSPEEREFVEIVARQSAQALARAQRLERERAAARLAERLRASLATTLRSIGDAVIATDAAGNVTLMNGIAERLTGHREADAVGRPLAEVFHIVNEHTRETVESPVEKVLRTGGIVGLANHTVLIARDGREIPIDDSGAPIRSDGGAIEGVVLVFRDVSERKQEESRRAYLADATSALAESLEYETTVAKVAMLAVPRLADWCAVDLVVDGARKPKRLAVAHVDPKKIELAKELDAKYPPDPNAPTGVPNVLRTGRSEIYREIPDALLVAGAQDEEHLRIARELRLRSAMVVPLIAREHVLGAMTFVYAESGRVYGDEDLRLAEELARRCANAIENAKLYLSEQEARRAAVVANRAKDEFLAVVSHELRTPLNAIMGWAKMLGGHQLDESRRARALETIERNSVTMAQLIEDLLDMSRVVSGKLRLEVQHVELARIVDAAIESVRPAATTRNVELITKLDQAPAMVGDPVRLQQIVWNLLSNAVKFTPPGGKVETTLRADDDTITVSVKDTGKGIAPAFLPNVFEAFRQEDASPSRSRGGLGLGLAITRQLVELHGGRITAASEGEGRGATFTVTWPVSPMRDSAPRATRSFRADAAYDKPAHLRGLRVLVVDDDEDARRLVAAILEDCECAVRTASGVEEAMKMLRDEVPDILLSDIAMPDQNGYDLIAKVRALPRTEGGDIPAAALTAFARPEDRRRMLNAGFSIHLAKPIEPAELVAVVATLSRFVQRPRPPAAS